MRAKTIPHVEYEIFQHILDEIDISMVKEKMVVEPRIDKAEERFDKGAESAAQLIQNMMDRRRHKLPFDHPDFKEKEA
tara:strand:+ start:265 stop:498 length:234 start_codon:yes stop_codon:yes gene_type:complete